MLKESSYIVLGCKKILFLSFISFSLFCGCAKTTPSISIKESTKQEIANIQEDIKVLQCDDVAKKTLTLRLETIKSDVENISLSCETEKEVYKQEISKLKIIITILIMAICGIIYWFIRRK
jgi:dipeptide/tripeptide permease